jgi:hypothetical protein
MPDDPYLTVEEFAALTADEHHAIWRAHAERRIDTTSASPRRGSTLRYHREQALKLLGELEQAR